MYHLSDSDERGSVFSSTRFNIETCIRVYYLELEATRLEETTRDYSIK